jgi:hypothetical protein
LDSKSFRDKEITQAIHIKLVIDEELLIGFIFGLKYFVDKLKSSSWLEKPPVTIRHGWDSMNGEKMFEGERERSRWWLAAASSQKILIYFRNKHKLNYKQHKTSIPLLKLFSQFVILCLSVFVFVSLSWLLNV